MDRKEKKQTFLFRFKIFIWYLLTEPVRNMMTIWDNLLKILESLNKTITWIYIALVVMIISMFAGQKFMGATFLIALLSFTLLWEWESGNFMYRYRQKVKAKIKRDYERKKSLQHEEHK